MRRDPVGVAVLAALREDPTGSIASLAERVGHPVSAVNDAVEALIRAGLVRGPGFVLSEPRPVVVVGGAVMDTKTRIADVPVLHTSNPGHATSSPGGVGRNIAETIARFGHPTVLLTALGADRVGQELLRHTRAAGVDMRNMLTTNAPSGVYVAVLDDQSELLVGVADMSATEALTVRMLAAHSDAVAAAELVVVEGNIPASVMSWLLGFAAASRVPVVIDPVSVAKAQRIGRILGPNVPVLIVTPNLDELAALTGTDVADDVESIGAAAALLHAKGVEYVWVRRGPQGSVLHSRGLEPVLFPAPPVRLVDVTGAGDSMTAGFVYSYLQSGDVPSAARFGQALASLTVEGAETVRPDLTVPMVHDRADQTPPSMEIP